MSGGTCSGATNAYTLTDDGQRATASTGGATTTYRYDTAVGLPRLLSDGTRTYVWGAAGLAYTVTIGTGAIEVSHADALGSVRALTDATGTLTQTYRTDPFGNPTASQGPSVQPFRFTGEQADSTRLVYLRARMYDPQVGRFLQRDPLAKSAPGSQGWNRFSYVANNAVNYTDPSGHCLTPNSAPRCLEVAERVVERAGPAFARVQGLAGEAAAGITRNTQRIASVTRTAAYRIPDEIRRIEGTGEEIIREVENVNYQAYTKQMRDFVAYVEDGLARGLNRSFELVVREGTRLSKPLQDAVDAGRIILERTLP